MGRDDKLVFGYIVVDGGGLGGNIFMFGGFEVGFIRSVVGFWSGRGVLVGAGVSFVIRRMG